MFHRTEIAGVKVLAEGSYPLRKVIYFMIKQQPLISSYEVQKRMAPLCSSRTVRRAIHELAEEGKIERFGERNPHLKAILSNGHNRQFRSLTENTKTTYY